jgi:hypothetical protein
MRAERGLILILTSAFFVGFFSVLSDAVLRSDA